MNDANRNRHPYTLLGGQQLSLGWLSEPELVYLEDLKSRAEEGADYFDLLREVRGTGSRVLASFGGQVTHQATQSLFFQVAADIVERVGLRQGRVVDPAEAPIDRQRFVGMAEAARLIGMSRQNVHRALQKGQIRGRRVGKGNTWVVDLESALRYKKSRP